MDDRRGSGGEFIFGLFVGALAGATLAVLFTPHTGEEAREKLRQHGMMLGEKAKEISQELKEDAEELVEKVKEILNETSQRVKDATCQKMEEIAQMEESITAQAE